VGAVALVAAALASASRAQDQVPPEKLRPLAPFFQIRGPLPLYADGQPEQAAEQPAKKKRPLVAPFVRPKININTCTLAELQNLPGVNASMAAHILAGRPYRNFDDLARNGVPLNVVAGLRRVVTIR
jgi:DNA uptake protein ComE-like DNA-binding protein